MASCSVVFSLILGDLLLLLLMQNTSGCWVPWASSLLTHSSGQSHASIAALTLMLTLAFPFSSHYANLTTPLGIRVLTNPMGQKQ